jgi:RNA-directed DNA polymerase
VGARGYLLARFPRPTRHCKDGKRRRADCAETSFTFLGYTFRARNAPTWDGTSMFTGFLPAVSKDALKRMSKEVRSWRIHLRTAKGLQDLADWINPIVRKDG